MVVCDGTNELAKLSLRDDKKSVVVDGKAFHYAINDPIVQEIGENEMIIGIYGVKDKEPWISSLGFIVMDVEDVAL